MRILLLTLVSIGFLFIASSSLAQKTPRQDAILGKWKADGKVLTIEVYKSGKNYRGRILSFTDHHNNIPSEQRTDVNNPNSALRARKMIGMDVLYNLTYNTSDENWTGGKIYDAKSGKEYDAIVELTEAGKLSVRAYVGFSLLGKTMTFHR